MLDISISYNKYKFLGKEFLTWLWFVIETGKLSSLESDTEPIFMEIGNRIVLEKHRQESDRQETITIKGDDASLDEGIIALQKGAVVSELNLIYKHEEQTWQFTIKGESLHLTGLKTPEGGHVETEDDMEGALLEKFFLYDRILKVIDTVFHRFIHIRLSNEWAGREIVHIRKWIFSEGISSHG
jgi:hypothetical protein